MIAKPHGRRPSFPNEVWSIIFGHATAFHEFRYRSRNYSDMSEEELQAEWKVSLKTRLGIRQVCRTWYEVGRHLIFEHIALDNIPLLAGVLRVLEDDKRSNRPAGYGRSTKTIVLSFMLGYAWLTVCDALLQRLFISCPNLHTLVDGMLQDFDYRMQNLDTTPGKFANPTLTHLDISGDSIVEATTLHLFAATLESLTLKCMAFGRGHVIGVVDLPKLKDLNLCGLPKDHMMTAIHWPTLFDSTRAPKWHLPSLRSLTVHAEKETRDDDFSNLRTGVMSILQQHGTKLTSLIITPDPSITININLSEVFALCPSLTHLSFPLHPDAPNPGPPISALSHESIISFGIRFDWIVRGPERLAGPGSLLSASTSRQNRPWIFQAFQAAHFPSLRRIYAIDAPLDGVVDSQPHPWAIYSAWRDWMAHWPARGVALENKWGKPLRFCAPDFWEELGPVTPTGKVKGDEEVEEESSASEYDFGLTDARSPSEDNSAVSDDGDDRQYRYKEQLDVLVSEMSEEEGGMEIDPEEIDEATAFEICGRIVEGLSSNLE